MLWQEAHDRGASGSRLELDLDKGSSGRRGILYILPSDVRQIKRGASEVLLKCSPDLLVDYTHLFLALAVCSAF
jgi:hypothetical protein